MADNRRGAIKPAKKDQQVLREVRGEMGSEREGGSSPTYRNPNRDQARGDWDRSRRHTDEDLNRDEGKDGDVA